MKQDVYYADIQWDEVLKLVEFVSTYFKPLAKFHPVKRDLSLLIDEIDELKNDLNEATETIKMYEKLRKATCNIS